MPIFRLLSSRSYLSRRTSRSLRMDNLFWATVPPRFEFVEKKQEAVVQSGSPAPSVPRPAHFLREVVSICRNGRSPCSGIAGQLASESVVSFLRNEWSAWPGIRKSGQKLFFA